MTASLLRTAVQLRPQQDSRCAGACQATHLEVWPNQPQIITREEAAGEKKNYRAGPEALCNSGAGSRLRAEKEHVGMEGPQVFFKLSI